MVEIESNVSKNLWDLRKENEEKNRKKQNQVGQAGKPQTRRNTISKINSNTTVL